jgi:hypothetical protein
LVPQNGPGDGKEGTEREHPEGHHFHKQVRIEMIRRCHPRSMHIFVTVLSYSGAIPCKITFKTVVIRRGRT